jgi:hypothetical protein
MPKSITTPALIIIASQGPIDFTLKEVDEAPEGRIGRLRAIDDSDHNKTFYRLEDLRDERGPLSFETRSVDADGDLGPTAARTAGSHNINSIYLLVMHREISAALTPSPMVLGGIEILCTRRLFAPSYVCQNGTRIFPRLGGISLPMNIIGGPGNQDTRVQPVFLRRAADARAALNSAHQGLKLLKDMNAEINALRTSCGCANTTLIA